jgi:Flp pilus assembly protein TadD
LLAACAKTTAFAHGSHDEMVGEIMEELATHPDDPQLYLLLADANCSHGDWEIALQNLQRVEELAPGKLHTDLIRGRALLTGGQVQVAKEALDRYLAVEPHSVSALSNRARANQILENTVASLADYKHAVQLSANSDPKLIVEYAGALVVAGRRDDAIRALSAGIEQLGPVPSLVLAVMNLEMAAGRFDDALQRIDAMQRSAPQPEQWMAKRAALLDQAGRREEAQVAWQALVDHLSTLPNLQRGAQPMVELDQRAQRALGTVSAAPLAPVFAPPAAPSFPASQSTP